MSEEEIKQMKKVLKQQWGDTDNLVNDALCYINNLEQLNKELEKTNLILIDYQDKEQEIERLNNIIKEVRKYIEEYRGDCPYSEYEVDVLDEPEKLLEILDKEKE